jgi:hypothetical protein
MAVKENPHRWANYVPYIWLVYLAALFVQPAFDPSAGVRVSSATVSGTF